MPITVLLLLDKMMVILMRTKMRKTVRILVMMMIIIMTVMKLAITNNSAPLQWGVSVISYCYCKLAITDFAVGVVLSVVEVCSHIW